MFRLLVSVAILVAMATGQDVLTWKMQMADMNGTTPAYILQEFQKIGQAQAADLNSNGLIDISEFRSSVFISADASGDGVTSLAEFMDAYTSRYSFLPPPVAAVMFLLLDRLNVDSGVVVPVEVSCNLQENIFSNVIEGGDGVLNDLDVTFDLFDLPDNPTIAQVQAVLDTWVLEAAQRVKQNIWRPFKIGKAYDEEFDYPLFFKHLDVNADDIITVAEVTGLLQMYSPSGSVSRTQWVDRNRETYGRNELVSAAAFDYIDFNNDGILDTADIPQMLLWTDANGDQRTTKGEAYRWHQRMEKSIRRMLGLPLKPFVYDCPEPIWRNDDDGCQPITDATVIVMDLDFNFDGQVTKEEIWHLLASMDKNMNGKVDRVEAITFYHERYGQDMATADLEFDAGDSNGDGYLSWEDVAFSSSYGAHEDSLCVCELLVDMLASLRAAEHLTKERQRNMDMVRWKYYLLMKQDQDTVEFSRGHDLQQWNWQTMNGRPAWGECKRCTARENWGMSDQDRDGGDDGAAVEMGDEEWAVVRMLARVMKKLAMNEVWSNDGDWKVLKLLTYAKKMMKETKDTKDAAGDWSKWIGWQAEEKKEDDWSKWLGWQAEEMKKKKDDDWSKWVGWQNAKDDKKDEKWEAMMKWAAKIQEKKEEKEKRKGLMQMMVQWMGEEKEKKEEAKGEYRWPSWKQWVSK